MSESRSTRSDILGAIVAGVIVVVFCLLLLWHDPLVFWNDDYELSVLPVFADVARSWSEGHLPLLSPYSWVCNNLAGEFQYGTFSLFINAAVVLIWKFPLTFPQQAATLSITHLFALAGGAFLLARGRELSVSLSIFVALIAALNGWIICWGASDWFGALGAFAWLPWAWWALEKSVASASSRCFDQIHRQDADATKRHRKRLMIAALWPAPFIYLVITGGFPYTVLMLVLLIIWLACRVVALSGGGSIKSLTETKNLGAILPMLLGAALGFGLSAPAWLAIVDYVHGSVRELQPAAMHWQWIVPWRALPGFILPCWTVNWADFGSHCRPHTATELTCGLVAPIALIGGLITRWRSVVKRTQWELTLLFLVLLLSMLPMFGVFRWSFRWLPFFHLILALCAAESLRTLHERNQAESTFRWPGSATPATSALALVALTAFAMSMLHVGGTYAFPLTWTLLGTGAIWLLVELFVRNRLLQAWLPAGVTFIVFLATYLCIPPNSGVPKFNLSQKLLEAAPLDQRRLYLSIYPPPEWNYRIEAKPQPVGQVVRPGSTSMWAGLRFINGYSPIRPAGVAREFNFAIHGEIDWAIGESLPRDRSATLDRLGIDGIIAAPEFSGNPAALEWQLVFANDEGRVFHRAGEPLATVRSVDRIESFPGQEFVRAEISHIDDSRNRVSANVEVPRGDKPALLKFSRPYFPGYVAQIDETKLTVDSDGGLVPIVKVPAGSRGQLILAYRPWWLIWGGTVAAMSGLVFVIGTAWSVRKSL